MRRYAVLQFPRPPADDAKTSSPFFHYMLNTLTDFHDAVLNTVSIGKCILTSNEFLECSSHGDRDFSSLLTLTI